MRDGYEVLLITLGDHLGTEKGIENEIVLKITNNKLVLLDGCPNIILSM